VVLFQQAKVVDEWVGFRPGRTGIRLEKELMNVGGKVVNVSTP
jgi:hypothetical protein